MGSVCIRNERGSEVLSDPGLLGDGLVSINFTTAHYLIPPSPLFLIQ